LDTTVSTPLVGRNRIINGDMRVAQRSSAAFASGANGYAGPDRWFVGNTGTGGTIQQQVGAFTINGVSTSDCAQIATVASTNMTGGNYISGITQVIEGYNCFDLLGQNVTVSFWFYATATGQYSVTLRDYTATKSCVIPFTYNVANTGQYVSVTFPALPTSMVVPNSSAGGLWLNIGSLNNGTYQTSNTGTWLSGNYFSATGNANWPGTINAIIAATNVQLEAGSVATPFERRSIAQELALCQRYYWAATIQVVGTMICNGSGNASTGYLPFPVQMRVAPSVGYASGSFTVQPGGASVTGYTLSSNTNGFILSLTTAGGLTIGSAYQMVGGNGLSASAEL
jgi:hypothetical protein